MEVLTEVRHLYRPGDEVVVELAGAGTYNIERGSSVDARCLPDWTIGVVLDLRSIHGEAAYALRVEHDDCACVCTVTEAAIEGLA